MAIVTTATHASATRRASLATHVMPSATTMDNVQKMVAVSVILTPSYQENSVTSLDVRENLTVQNTAPVSRLQENAFVTRDGRVSAVRLQTVIVMVYLHFVNNEKETLSHDAITVAHHILETNVRNGKMKIRVVYILGYFFCVL